MFPPSANPLIIHRSRTTRMTASSTPARTLQAFQAALQTRFRVGVGEGPEVELVLVEVRAVGSASEGDSFSILFRGPGDPVLPQRMYPFTHEALGRFHLFIVPVGRHPDGLEYEAVFNRTATGA
jgi:hypothetical protein